MPTAIPSLIYGTAWKEEKTAELAKKAILAGFRAIDTANQKKHYREDFLGEVFLDLANQGIRRESLFIQTKFTYLQAQDSRLPYNPADSLTEQVKSSFTSSLTHLGTDYLDSYLLHGPSSDTSISDDDWEVWNTLEEFHKTGQVKMIGVSNVDLHQIAELTLHAKVKPMIVQNRCYARLGWDEEVRNFCLSHGIVYQGFSLLTANRHVLQHPELVALAKSIGVTPQQVIFRFSKQIGILPITGTSSEQHMKEDLKILEFELKDKDIELILNIST